MRAGCRDADSHRWGKMVAMPGDKLGTETCPTQLQASRGEDYPASEPRGCSLERWRRPARLEGGAAKRAGEACRGAARKDEPAVPGKTRRELVWWSVTTDFGKWTRQGSWDMHGHNDGHQPWRLDRMQTT